MAREGGSLISNFKMDVRAWSKSCYFGLLVHGNHIHGEQTQIITGMDFSLLKQ
jgi:hypothetical protein